MMVPRSLRKGQKGLEEKKEDPEVAVEVERNEQGQESEDWASLTVSKLKDVCKELGLAVGGRKADIIKRIEDHKVAHNAAMKEDKAVAAADNIGDAATSMDEKSMEDVGDGDGIKFNERVETEPETESDKEENENIEEATDIRTSDTVEVVTPDEAKLPDEAEEIHAIAKSISCQSADEEGAAIDNRSEAEAEVEALLGGSDDEHIDIESRKRTFDQNEEDALEDFQPEAKKQAKESLENGSSSPMSVKIDNFVRPFTLVQARGMVEQAADENGLELNEKTFFMNKIKTYAIVTLPSKECAHKVIDALGGLQWPERSVKRLNAAISSMSALEATAEVSRHDALKALEVIGRPRRIGSSDGVSPATAVFHREGERVIEREVEPGVVEREAQSHVAEQGPDKLFQKTTVLPPLYWISLSEEDVSLKRVRIELEKAKASKKHQGQDADRSTEGQGKQHSSDRSQDHERAISCSPNSDRSRDRSRGRGSDQSMDYGRDRSRGRSISRGRRQSRSWSQSRSSNRSWRRSHLLSRSWDRGGHNRVDRHRRRGYSPDRFMSSRRGSDTTRRNICYGWESGNCRFGSNCRFYHNGPKGDGGGSPPRRGNGTSRQPCRDYGRGYCRYGEDCKYLH